MAFATFTGAEVSVIKVFISGDQSFSQGTVQVHLYLPAVGGA